MSKRYASAHSGMVRLRSNPAISRSRAAASGNRVVDGVERQQRVTWEVHLGDQPLLEGMAEEGEVDVGGPPRVRMVPPRVRAWLDGDEAEAAIVVGQAPSDPGEVRVEGGRMVVQLVRVPARRVGLPGLDERGTHRATTGIGDATRDDDPLAERSAGVLAGQVGVRTHDPTVVEDRPGPLGEAAREQPERPLRCPEAAGDVVRIEQRRIDRPPDPRARSRGWLRCARSVALPTGAWGRASRARRMRPRSDRTCPPEA